MADIGWKTKLRRRIEDHLRKNEDPKLLITIAKIAKINIEDLNVPKKE